ncbi:hypothetical protein A3E15_02820 [Candidatus Woesebacteria bacterium RIFCSPHIGHO2_12_FULL_42_9]|uniref:Uncharacterized protein n=1 Tax=Candidatus Woesebacteria bacterium RIFCSPHIGHO2_12_FULL_42_9 TaxID=1802511 RepID=A0A1F8AR59_9BACT|nr:MAG: hypothetical protein A3E15_02820 [Candidatus Woesebacteria bacterium RIFCSPHIGHO2_12_FULL_42_9]
MDTPAQNDPSAPAPVITSNTAAEDKGKSLKKVAIILGGFIVLIILFELAYLGYTRFLAPQKTSTPTQEAEIPSNGPKKINIDKVTLYSDILYGLKDKSSFFLSANTNLVIGGKVRESDLKEEVIDEKRYVYKLVLENDEDQTLVYRFTEGDLNNMKVYLTDAEVKTEIKPEDVKVGYYAIVRTYVDLLDSSLYDTVTLDVSPR